MAMHKQTTAFEDVPPAYYLSEDVEEAAQAVIADNLSFRELSDLRVAYAIRTDSPYAEDDGIDDIVGVSVENAMRRCLGNYDAIVWVKEDYWGRNPGHHDALLTHALSHLFVNEDGKLKKVGHDVEAFHREARKHGAWRGPLSTFWSALAIDKPAKGAKTKVTITAGGKSVETDTDAIADLARDPDKVVDLANQARRAREGRDQ